MAKQAEGKSLVKKLIEIRSQLGPVKKEHRNPHFGYNYVGLEQLNALLQPKLSEQNIWLSSSVVSESVQYGDSKAGVFSNVATEHTFTDGDSDAQITLKSAGLGWDSGDKATAKAITAAVKSFLKANFMISDEADDPEAGEQAPESKPKGAEGHRRTKPYEEETGEGDKKVAGDLIELKAFLTAKKIPDGFLLRLLEEKKLIDGHTKNVAQIKPGILRRVLAPKSLENLELAWKQQKADEDNGSQTAPEREQSEPAIDEPSPSPKGSKASSAQAKGATASRSDEYDQTRRGRQPVDEGTSPADLLEQEGYDNWREVEIHFGEKKGKVLGKLPQKSLAWWVDNWTPKPYRGTWDEKDLLLDAALVLASAELGGGE